MDNKLVSRKDEQLISFEQLRTLIGVLGIALPFLLIAINWDVDQPVDKWSGTLMTGESCWRETISDNFYSQGGHVFTGTLFFLGCLFFTYRGLDAIDNRLANLAAVCALGVAFCPCHHQNRIISTSHFVFAVSLFLIFCIFSIFIFTKTRPGQSLEEVLRNDPRKGKRNLIYRVCGVGIFIQMLACLVIFYLRKNGFDAKSWIFSFETGMLICFGISWIVKGKRMFRNFLYGHAE